MPNVRKTDAGEAEPVAWQRRNRNNDWLWVENCAPANLDLIQKLGWEIRPLYAAPAQCDAVTTEAREALEALLAYEQERAKNNGWSDCTCMGQSRESEQAYEMGQCPHQKARALLSHLPVTDEAGREESSYDRSHMGHPPMTLGQRILSSAQSEIPPHVYTPDYQAMGDCRVCGHPQNRPWHLYTDEARQEEQSTWGNHGRKSYL